MNKTISEVLVNFDLITLELDARICAILGALDLSLSLDSLDLPNGLSFLLLLFLRSRPRPPQIEVTQRGSQFPQLEGRDRQGKTSGHRQEERCQTFEQV